MTRAALLAAVMPLALAAPARADFLDDVRRTFQPDIPRTFEHDIPRAFGAKDKPEPARRPPPDRPRGSAPAPTPPTRR